MCAQKAGSNTLETCSWDRGWVLWKSAHSAQRVHKVQRVHEVQTPSSLMASLSAHNRVPIHKPTQRKGVYKCICVQTAPQPCYKGWNFLREYHDVQRTHLNTPGGPFQCCPDCSATPRFRWTRMERPALRGMSMLLCLHEMPRSRAGNLDEFRTSSKIECKAH